MRKNSADHVSQLTAAGADPSVAPSAWVTEYDAAFRRNRRKKMIPSVQETNRNKELADISAVIPAYSDNDDDDDDYDDSSPPSPPAAAAVSKGTVGKGKHYQVKPKTSFESILPSSVADHDDNTDHNGDTTSREQSALSTEYSDHFKSYPIKRMEIAKQLIPAAGKSSARKNEEATRPGRASSASHRRTTDTLGQAAAIRAELALSRGETVEPPAVPHTLKKRGPAFYERPQVKPSTAPDSVTTHTGDNMLDMSLSETQNQFRWPQSDRENDSSLANRFDASTSSSFMEDSLNPARGVSKFSPTATAAVKKVPRPATAAGRNVQDFAKTVTPAKKPYR